VVNDPSVAAVNRLCRLGNLDYQLYLGKHPKASVIATAHQFTLTRQQILQQATRLKGATTDVLHALAGGVRLAERAELVVVQKTDAHPLIAASMAQVKAMTALGLEDCARVR
jgi:hypothetical protein